MDFDTTALKSAGIADGGILARDVLGRANVFEMTQAAEDAVLRPEDPGAWPHTLRAALAARIAILNDAPGLAETYMAGAGEHAPLADTASDGADLGLSAVVAFMDKVAARTRDVRANDVTALQTAGVADADIVRLAELNAFLAYQIRVVAGLRLMREAGK